MILKKRIIVSLLVAFTLVFVAYKHYSLSIHSTTTDTDHALDNDFKNPQLDIVQNDPAYITPDLGPSPFKSTAPLQSSYTRGLVIGHLTTEDVSWAHEYASTSDIFFFPYAVDNTTARFHTTLNKAHEVTPYLTYILEHYDTLPDISIFMHPHRRAWHTPELLNHDAVELLNRLNPERVIQHGYMNLRCAWDPGCPERIYPGRTEKDYTKVEEVAMAKAFRELFPGEDVPSAIGAPCCAQFAVARHRIQSIPKTRFEAYMDWVRGTAEDDWTSGRIFEYLWQKIFAGQNSLCPDARSCYCDAYGICFGHAEFEAWFDNTRWWRAAGDELIEWNKKATKLGRVPWEGIEFERLDIPAAGRNLELRREMNWRQEIMEEKRAEALQNGTDSKLRELAVQRSKQDIP